ncbi:MAG TPA: glycosyltransferase family A protein [Pyrinomonadaceae bacterium]|jgi:GalNAc5-diNAcBac-PP-undecaprenol beta-1,3-glucosyltransferase|nr:glycosyltransferase family A protein [Pyrinomonadaceae bacterium]
MPSFSVVIPSYNRAAFIVATVNSVLAQEDCEDFEVIIVDDGSTDDTARVVEQNYAGDDRVRYIRQANAERGAARNHGLKEARGRYVVFFDSDDLMHRDHLSTLAGIVRERPDVNFLATKYDILRDGQSYPSSLGALAEGFYGLDLFLRGNPLACNVCVRRENPHLSPFEEDRRYAVFEDWMFMVQNLASDRLYLSERVTISLVDHANRSMRGDNREIIRKNRLARDWITERVPLSEDQLRVLDGYSHYFCAIHSYLEGDRRNGFRHLYQAARTIGLKANVAALWLKLVIGQKLLRRASRGFKRA